MQQKPERIRKSTIAGTWYPGRPDELKTAIEGFLRGAEKPSIAGDLRGLFAPHAGYAYSGQVAAYAYKQIQDNGSSADAFDLIAVISPVHRMPLGEFATTQAAHYETPLGLVSLDADAVDSLDRAVGLNRARMDNEHSLEIQLPFLQVLLGEFKLLPVMMGSQSLASCQRLADALADLLCDRAALLVASTDLSHFYPYNRAKEIDRQTLQYVDDFDPEGLARALKNGKAEACGGGPVVAAMLTARALGADSARVLKYANSGDVTGDRNSVVGYAAGVIYRERMQRQLS